MERCPLCHHTLEEHEQMGWTCDCYECPWKPAPEKWAVQMWHPELEWMHVRKIEESDVVGTTRPLIKLQRNLEESFKLSYEDACALSREVTRRGGKTTRIYRVGTEDYIMGDIL